MAAEKSYAGLGLFLVLVLGVVLATALFFIQRMRSRAVIDLVTYTNENVSGLDISSPVRYRGVPIGRVADIRVVPNTGLVEIDFEVFVDRLHTVGINVAKTQATARSGLFEKLRAQVVSNPVTGEGYLFLDSPLPLPPPIDLGFTPERGYIPSMPSPMSKLQDRLPEVLERAESTLKVLREIVARIPESLDLGNRFLTNVQQIIEQSELPALSSDTRKFLSTTTNQLAHFEQVTTELAKLVEISGRLDKLAEETRAMLADTRATIKGADFPATTKTAREMLERTSLAADDVRRSLPVITDSLEQVRRLARRLEDEPESVVYGPRPTGAKGK